MGIKKLSISEAPTRLFVPEAMQLAQARLLSELAPNNPPEPKYLQNAITSPSSSIFFAINGELPLTPEAWHEVPEEAYVGTLTLMIGQTSTQRVGIIEDLVVEPGFRRQGIGTALIDHVFTQTKFWGIERVDFLY